MAWIMLLFKQNGDNTDENINLTLYIYSIVIVYIELHKQHLCQDHVYDVQYAVLSYTVHT